MPAITDPNEPYFKDGIWGWAATLWQRLISDGGRLYTAIHGWDGAAWHRLPMVWGYSDRWADTDEYTMLADATYSRTTAAVPAGYVYKLEVATFYNATGTRGRADIDVFHAADPFYLAWHTAPPQWQPLVWTGSLTLKEGDQIRFYQRNAITGDVIRTAAWGYKMLIAE